MNWEISYNDSIAVVTYNRPPDNQMDLANLRCLDELLRDVSNNENISLVILTSNCPGYFVAHADREEIINLKEGRKNKEIFEHWFLTTLRLESMPQPVVAAINGQAWGGGLELSLACTLRVGSDAAHFCLMEVSRNAMPGAGGTQRLPRVVGPGRAAEMILKCNVINAQEALSMGLLNTIVDKNNFTEDVMEWVAPIAAQPRDSLIAAKQALVASQRLPIAEGLNTERELFLNLVMNKPS